MSTTKAFLIHKPIGAISSTVDSKLNSIIMNKDDPLCGQTYSNKGVTSRPTVYDYAQLAGFPTNFSLVGRLDVATSGIMLFTNDTILDKVWFCLLYLSCTTVYKLI
jgi:16S rRNA U516 pseudouridylate synthase RsuA-like enzyme